MLDQFKGPSSPASSISQQATICIREHTRYLHHIVTFLHLLLKYWQAQPLKNRNSSEAEKIKKSHILPSADTLQKPATWIIISALLQQKKTLSFSGWNETKNDPLNWFGGILKKWKLEEMPGWSKRLHALKRDAINFKQACLCYVRIWNNVL